MTTFEKIVLELLLAIFEKIRQVPGVATDSIDRKLIRKVEIMLKP